eukprot:6863397-Pyramimonas_sp.AAC.1
MHQAGAPAGGSDGSWIQAQSADVTGMTSSGIDPADMLCADDPLRAQVQQLPVPAGQPASFAPMSKPQFHSGLHRVLGAPIAYRQGSKACGSTRSSTRL